LGSIIVFIPVSFEKYKAAWNVANEMSKLARGNNKNATKEIEQLKEQYEKKYGHAYEPSLHNPYRGPMVVIEKGIVHMGYTVGNVSNPEGIGAHVECLAAIIKIVSSEFIPYAKIGINFLMKHRCSLCTLPISGWGKDPYYFFINNSHPHGCPHLDV
jgi:hypothetical protein